MSDQKTQERFSWSIQDITIEKPTVQKYDPSEARDERGRWTAGGEDSQENNIVQRIIENLKGGLKASDYPSGRLPTGFNDIKKTYEGFPHDSYMIKRKLEQFPNKESEEKARASLSTFMQSHEPSMNVPIGVLNFIVGGDNRRIESGFTTGTTQSSGGHLGQSFDSEYKRMRVSGESKQMGIPTRTDEWERPVYGHMAPIGRFVTYDPNNPDDQVRMKNSIDWVASIRDLENTKPLYISRTGSVFAEPSDTDSEVYPIKNQDGTYNYNTIACFSMLLPDEHLSHHYGAAQIVFNRDVLDNATITHGDSLQNVGYQVSVPARMAESGDSRIPILSVLHDSKVEENSNGWTLEVQYQKPLHTSDIKEVKFYTDKSKVDSETIQRLELQNIPYSFSPPKPKPDTAPVS